MNKEEAIKYLQQIYHNGGYCLLDNQRIEAIGMAIQALQEKPVSDDLEDATNNYCVNVRKGYPRVMDETDRYICNAFKAGAQWQKEKEESTTEDLGEYINELSKQFPEVSFAKLSRIAVRVTKWHRDQIEEALLSEVLPCFMHGGEADEVVAKLDEVLKQK